jgi:hypothetical protein
MIRNSLVSAVLALAIVSSSCSSLVGGRDSSIPRLQTPLANAEYDELISRLKQFTELQSLRTSQVYLQFLDAVESYRYPEAVATLILQRPDKIRLLVQAPAIRSKISDMVSESNKFKVAIYYGDYKYFLLGSNNADYTAWRESLGDKGRSALTAARPFHFTEILMMRPINDQLYTYSFEESHLVERDSRRGSKKGAQVIRSYYVISELELPSSGAGPARVQRRFWFDRTNGAVFVRQQLFDNQNQLSTDIFYSDYKRLNAGSAETWPSAILLTRPHDNYSARITLHDDRFEINPELQPNTFVLQNTEGLRETDLDKPIIP